MSSLKDGSPMDWQYDTPPATKRSYEDYTEQSPPERPTRTYLPTRRIHPNTSRYATSEPSPLANLPRKDSTAEQGPIERSIRTYPNTCRADPNEFRFPSSTPSPSSSQACGDTEMMDVDTDDVYDIPAGTDHVYELPNAHSNIQNVYMSGGLPAPIEATAQPTLIRPAPTEATWEQTLMRKVGASIYNVTLWTGLCLANGLSYSQPYIRTAAASSRRCITRSAVDTYRVAAQVVNGVKRRAVETRVPRPAPTSQEERREILRASHRPLRSPRQRPSTSRPSNMTTHTTESSSRPPAHNTGASLEALTVVGPEGYGFDKDWDYIEEYAPDIHEIEERMISKWGLKRAKLIFFKWLHRILLTDEEADIRTPQEVALDEAEEAEEARQAGRQVESSPLSSAPSSIEKYRPAGLGECEITPFSSSLSSPPSSIEKYRPASLEESRPFSSPLPSAAARIERYRPASLDQCESFSSPLSSAPSSIEKYRPASLDESQPFSSPLSSAPASIEKYRPASLEKSTLKRLKTLKTPKTPKTVAFHLSPTTGAPVTQVKRFIIGESMDYMDVPSPITAFSPGTIARTEAEASDSPVEHHIAHMERRRDEAVLQPIQNNAVSVAKAELDVIDSPISKRRTLARNTLKKQKAEEARVAKAAKEAEKKAKEEEARKKRNERRMPEERVIKPLTAEWERRVDAAMAAGDGTQLAATSAGCALWRRDLGTVLPVPGRDRAGGWLNDEVVTGYLQAVVDHGQSTTASTGRGKTPKFYAFNTFFYSSIRDKGVESVRKWAGKGRIGGRSLLEVERVFVPVHENSHWTLVVVSPMARAIEYFDSLGGAGTRHVGHVKAWLAQELGPEWVEGEWTVVDSPSPRQTNGLDCGVFAVTTAKMITLGINPLAYGPEDIPVQRRRMVAELLNRGFVGDFEP